MELLTVEQLTQHFGAVPALSDINFTLESGEILGIVGQRGAGKSTLFKLLSGVHLPSSGTITFAGKHVLFYTVAQAQQQGIIAVQQQPQLVESMNVLHNAFLGQEIRTLKWLKLFPQEAQMLQITRQLLTDFDMPPDLAEECVANLSNEHRQIVALARALCHPYRLLLLDDALAALNFARQQRLLDRVKELAAQQVSIILSSDDLKQIFAVTDRILVLYQGRQIALRRTAETTPREIVELIVGSNRQERVTPMIWAFENYYAAQQQTEQLRQAQLELQQSLEEKDSLNRRLIERLGNQLEALDRLNLALQEAGRRAMDEREAERKSLARELHDEVIQDLLSYTYQVEEAEANVIAEPQRLALVQIRNGIRQVVGSLRQICSDLRPPTIDNHGLSAAIRSLSSQWSKQTSISVELLIDPTLGRLPETIELSVFRIIQEGLRNVQKHTVATRVTLTLQRTSTASLIVRLIDNGHGMAKPMNLAALTEQKHFGLVGISERVSLLNGSLQVTSPPNGGVELEIEIPSPYPSIRN